MLDLYLHFRQFKGAINYIYQNDVVFEYMLVVQIEA